MVFVHSPKICLSLTINHRDIAQALNINSST
jgi:hypothetical protein